MKALVLVENGRLIVEDRPVPQHPAAGMLLVRVAAAGICGSDIPRAFEDGAYHYPLVMGHEFSGTIAASGSGTSTEPGERVTVFPLVPDPAESINQIGQYALGRDYDYYGSRRDGAFQEMVAIPEFNCVRVPDDVSLELAAMTEPCAVAYHAANRARIEPGMSAAVFGGGPIGNMAAQWLRIRGCRPVVVSEPDEKKRTIAADMGFETIDPSSVEPVGAVGEITKGGADVAVEACGFPITFRQAIASVGLFGQVVFLGNIHGDFVLEEREFSSVLRREITIYGTWNSRFVPKGADEWTRVLSYMRRELDLGSLISHRAPLDEGPGILEAMHRKTAWYNKAIFVIDAGK